jgi:hypothetical protein
MMSGTPEEPDEFLLALIRAVGLERTYFQFPDDVIAAVRGAKQESEKLETDRTEAP